jgi:hypothetical protein
MTPNPGDDRLSELREELTATEELPVDRTASRWIGEAQALAKDIESADTNSEVIQDRLSQIEQLLENVDTTENAVADEHLTAAKSLLDEMLS